MSGVIFPFLSLAVVGFLEVLDISVRLTLKKVAYGLGEESFDLIEVRKRRWMREGETARGVPAKR